MSKITKSARGKECTIRIPDVCCWNPETTVFAHYRMATLNGVSMKPDDIFGAYACFECHNALDRRSHTDLDGDYLRLLHLEGVLRTQAQLKAAGLIKA